MRLLEKCPKLRFPAYLCGFSSLSSAVNIFLTAECAEAFAEVRREKLEVSTPRSFCAAHRRTKSFDNFSPLINTPRMDWKYKRFHQERLFPASLDLVLEAARTFVSDSLGWQTTETPEGFSAEGYSFSHRALAEFHFQSAAGGTKVSVALRVERAGATGFMLFDVGGYYSIQIRKWLDGIQWTLHQKQTDGQSEMLKPAVPAGNKAAAFLFNGCLVFIVVMFALWFLVNFIAAVIGLVTGTLYLWGRGGTLVVHGLWARIISTLILLFGAWLVWRIQRQRSKRITYLPR